MDTNPNPIVPRPCPFPPRTEPVIWGKGRLKVEMMLGDADRAAYEAMLSNPKTTVQAAWAWLKSKGYAVGYNAVCNHKRQFTRDIEQLRRAARAAAAYSAAADSVGGPEAFGAAALTRINELAMDHLFDDQRSAAVTTAVLNELARTIDKSIAARGRLEALRPKLEESRRQQEGHEQADGRAVVERVRQILGMPPLPPELLAERRTAREDDAE